MNSPLQPGQDGESTRNLVIAMVLIMAILLGYDLLVGSRMREQVAAERRAAAAQAELQKKAPAEAADPAAPAAPRTRPQAIAASPRLPLETPSLKGTINLQGARFDDLALLQYRQTVDETSASVNLFTPEGVDHHFDAFFGWEDSEGRAIANRTSAWTAPDGAKLTPQTPVTLTLTTDDGLSIARTISIDDHYMFTITDVVTNAGAAARTVRPFGTVRRTGLPDDFVPNQIVHQGMAGVFGPKLVLHEARYQKAEKHAKDKLRGSKLEDERIYAAKGEGGWLGMSDHYWLAALIPPQASETAPGEIIEGYFDSRPSEAASAAAATNFRAVYRGAPRDLAPGASASYTQHFFAGAKRHERIQAYKEALNIPRFELAIDWGFLWFLTQPFFLMLEFFGKHLGNFGLAIMAATVVVKALLFPLVNQSYKAMAQLKKIQPKMKEVQERFAADKQRQQQEMIKLYQTEKVNPVAGCLPILVQIPIFYALYKVLTVTLEMRHAPFFGWIQDLSAKDPTSYVNLFGLLPFSADPITSIPVIGGLFALGVWPILYGLTMWGVQSLSPPPPDPVQAMVFKFLPIVFVFLFAGFAAGLVIYWTWSNLLSIAQQYVIMRRNGVETEFDKFLAKISGKPAGAAP